MRFLITLILLIANQIGHSQDKPFAQVLYQAWQQHQAIPQLSLYSRQPLSEKAAYDIQQAYVSLRLNQDSIAGFKAGLTSLAGQKKFGVSGALYGVLFQSGEHQPTQPLQRNNFGKLMLETEIGFILAQDITQAPHSKEQLRKSIKAVVPVIELPDLGFEQPSKLTGIDIIAANVAASGWIQGQPLALNQAPDLNALSVTLMHNQEVINQSVGHHALGDQWQALSWLIKSLLQQGYALKEGQLLITGALGTMLPADKGHYRADFGALGIIEFTVE